MTLQENIIKCFGYIYMITNNINNKKYIGQTINIRRRYHEHIRDINKYNNHPLYNSIKKYGFDNFEFKIIDTADTAVELDIKEISLIQLYKTIDRNFGYNLETGGKNSKSHIETKRKLSIIRKKRKQNQEWINKRLLKVSKPVVKVDFVNNIILEKYQSLADAGKKNVDNLSYEQISRKCLAYVKNDNNICWCYEDDYLNNTIPKHIKNENILKNLNEFSENDLLKIMLEYKNSNVSVRELSSRHLITFSTINKYIKKMEKPFNLEFDKSKKYILVCKKTLKEFTDFINKSGCLTTHIQTLYPDFILESKFKRKQIEMKTGKPWYFNFFYFNELK